MPVVGPSTPTTRPLAPMIESPIPALRHQHWCLVIGLPTLIARQVA